MIEPLVMSDASSNKKPGPALATRQDLERQLAFRARLLNNVPGMVGYWDRELRNRYANKAYVEWFGMTPDEIWDRHIREVIGERLYELNLPFIEGALRGEPQLFERTIVGPDSIARQSQARYVPDVVDGVVDGFFVLVTDVSPLKAAYAELERARSELEQRVAERTNTLEQANAELRREIEEHKCTLHALTEARDELHHARKMEAVGRLAGGVAHDFNNLLMVVRGVAGLLLESIESGTIPTNLATELRAIDYAGLRAEQLTKQLLAFSRKQVLQPRHVDVDGLVAELTPLIRRLIGNAIEVVSELRADHASVYFDPGQLEQVLLNLCANARDAMPRGGRLLVATRCSGAEVVIAVEDTGTGMSQETLTRIFEPFFTTKALGRGTGLGLASVHGIVTQSGGRIDVRSQIGQGTSFELHLPRGDGPAEAPHTRSAPPAHAAPRCHENDTVLVVDDEPMVRAFVASTLQNAGYQVLEAGGLESAQRLVERDAPKLQLLLTDVVMPRGSGPTLAAWLRERDPDLKVLYMSGYHSPEQLAHIRDPLLSKPCQADTLLEAIRSVLDAPHE